VSEKNDSGGAVEGFSVKRAPKELSVAGARLDVLNAGNKLPVGSEVLVGGNGANFGSAENLVVETGDGATGIPSTVVAVSEDALCAGKGGVDAEDNNDLSVLRSTGSLGGLKRLGGAPMLLLLGKPELGAGGSM
jgi:hypothetical protein